MKFVLGLVLMSSLVHADNVTSERWDIAGKTFDNKALAIRYAMSTGKVQEITHVECLYLTQKLSFRKCPKNKKSSFENEPFTNVSDR